MNNLWTVNMTAEQLNKLDFLVLKEIFDTRIKNQLLFIVGKLNKQNNAHKQLRLSEKEKSFMVQYLQSPLACRGYALGMNFHKDTKKIAGIVKMIQAPVCANAFLGALQQKPRAQGDDQSVDTNVISSGHNPEQDASTQNKQMEVTQFIDDAEIVESSLPSLYEPKPFTAVSEEHVNVVSFLQRPTLVHSGEWSDTVTSIPYASYSADDSYQSRLYTAEFPAAILAANSAVLRKLSNIALFKAGVDVEVRVNSQPFQQGRLLLLFSPFQELVNSAELKAKSYMSGITGFPSVSLDLASGNSAKLHIPYCNFREAYNLVLNKGQFGHFELWVISPLKSGTVNYSVFGNFSNIHLSISAPVTNIDPTVIAQGLFSSEDGAAKISDVVTTVGKIASTLEGFPLIGKYATPVSWIGRMGGKLLAGLGLSKPENQSASTKITWKPAMSMLHGEGSDDSVVLSVLPDNSLCTPHEVFPTDVDEMSIQYVASRMCVVDHFDWSNADEANKIIYKLPVTPMYCHSKELGYAGAYDWFNTTLSYLCAPAAYWSGTLRYKFSFVKTVYHSGRVRISFWPFTDVTVGSITNDAQNAYNVILDLRESNEIIIDVPYVATAPWLINRYTQTQEFDVTSSGSLVVEVINPLVANDIVAPKVEVLISIAAGSDFKLAGWGIGEFDNIPGYAPTLPIRSHRKETMIEAQVLASGIDDNVIKLFKAERDIGHATQNCIGEDVFSLRTLLKRFFPVGTSDVSAGHVQLPEIIEPIGIDVNSSTSWDFVGYSGMDFMPGLEDAHVGFFSYYQHLYRFYRGGTRAKFFHVGNKDDDAYININYGNNYVGRPFAAQTFQQGAVAEVTKPFYNNYDKRVTFWKDQKYRSSFASLQGFMDGKIHVYMAPSDDFSFAWLVGANPSRTYAGAGSTPSQKGVPKPVSTIVNVGEVTIKGPVAVMNDGGPLDVNVASFTGPVAVVNDGVEPLNVNLSGESEVGIVGSVEVTNSYAEPLNVSLASYNEVAILGPVFVLNALGQKMNVRLEDDAEIAVTGSVDVKNAPTEPLSVKNTPTEPLSVSLTGESEVAITGPVSVVNDETNPLDVTMKDGEVSITGPVSVVNGAADLNVTLAGERVDVSIKDSVNLVSTIKSGVSSNSANVDSFGNLYTVD